eukprot:7958302-Pyramimonas_sp.AAC.4
MSLASGPQHTLRGVRFAATLWSHPQRFGHTRSALVTPAAPVPHNSGHVNCGADFAAAALRSHIAPFYIRKWFACGSHPQPLSHIAWSTTTAWISHPHAWIAHPHA